MRITTFIAAAAICLGLSACQPGDGTRDPAVNDLWVRLPAVPGRPAAAYFTLEGGTFPSVLERASSTQASRIEMHESRMEGGMMRMEPLKEIAIPAGGEVKFEPGGKHLMIFGLDPALKADDLVKIRFEIQPPVEIVAEARLVAPGADAP